MAQAAAWTPRSSIGACAVSTAGGGGGKEGGGGVFGGTGGGLLGGIKGDGGGGRGGGKGGGDGAKRIPQSVQSVPVSQPSYSAPGPPSSQTPSFAQPDCEH